MKSVKRTINGKDLIIELTIAQSTVYATIYPRRL